MAALTESPAWRALEAHHRAIGDVHLRTLFADDPQRGERMTAEAAGIYFDYSKNRITRDTLKLLLDLANAVGLRDRIDAMFRGDKINVSENRAVLHVALRAPRVLLQARRTSFAKASACHDIRSSRASITIFELLRLEVARTHLARFAFL